MRNRFISVIIPCRNEENYISGCLNSFLESSYPEGNLELLVVDGESTDRTKEIVNKFSKKYPLIKLLNNEKRITPTALNIGIKNSKNSYILIASAHAEFPSNYLSNLIVKMKELNADGVGGQLITDVKNKTKKTISITRVLSNKFGVGNSMFRIGVDVPTRVDTAPFGLYKKELFFDVGLYNEALIRNHDIEWSKRLIRANKKIFLIPDVTCKYYARETFSQIAQNNYKNGYWNILTVYITKLFSSLSLRHFIPLIFILSLLIPISVALLIQPVFVFVSIFSLFAYLSLITISSIRINDKKTSFKYLWYGFVVLHFSYGIGSLLGLLRIDKLFLHDNGKKL